MKKANHLLIISWAFIFIGFLALVRTVDSLFNSPRPVIDFLVIFALIGFGLLRRKEMARVFAVACCTVALIFQVVTVALVLYGKRTAGTGVEVVLFWLINVVVIVASAYGLWALQSKQVRSVFKR